MLIIIVTTVAKRAFDRHMVKFWPNEHQYWFIQPSYYDLSSLIAVYFLKKGQFSFITNCSILKWNKGSICKHTKTILQKNDRVTWYQLLSLSLSVRVRWYTCYTIMLMFYWLNMLISVPWVPTQVDGDPQCNHTPLHPLY